MANLPNKSFVFNFNAKNYNTNTYTIPNESGASMQKDMVWSATTTTVRNNIQLVDGDHISVPLSAYSLFDFSTSGANPMNNTASAPAMTIIAKFRLTNGGPNLICNRDTGTYNWMARVGAYTASTVNLSFHTAAANNGSNQTVGYTKGSVVTALWRVNSSRQIEIKDLTTGTSNTPFTASWNNGSTYFTFFIWKNTSSGFTEPMAGEFYWCYASREVLTDEEIQQVIKFNESSFGPDEDGADVPASGGSVSVNLSAEGVSWTASTTSNWITISPTTGTGDSTVTLTVKNNNFSERTGTVTFASGAGDEASYTISQPGTDGLVPFQKIFRNDRRIN